MALTAEVLFVNPDYMKRMTQLNGGVEDAVMVPAIILAQDKYIQQYLGFLLKPKGDISGSGPTGDYETLLDSYVRKTAVWWSMVKCCPTARQTRQRGLVIGRPRTPRQFRGRLARSENARQNANFTPRACQYLCNNSSRPEYKSNQAPT